MTTSKRSKLVAPGRLRGAISRSPSKARTKTSLRLLARGLHDRSVDVSDLAAAVIEDLGGAGRPLIPALVRALRRRPRYAVGEALAGVGIPAVPVLGRLVGDSSRRVRLIAAWALGSPQIKRQLEACGMGGARARWHRQPSGRGRRLSKAIPES